MTIAFVIAIVLVLALIVFLKIFAVVWGFTLLAICLCTWCFGPRTPDGKEYATRRQLACTTLLAIPLTLAWIAFRR